MNLRNRNLGMLLLAIYLILTGALSLAGASLGQLTILIPILAVASGVLLIMGK